MLKLLILVLAFLGTAQAQECSSKNHIFLIHGIGGSAKTFGVMDKYLAQTNPCYIGTAFEYDTGNSGLSTHDFAGAFDKFLHQKLSQNGFTTNDKISLVMHSQGGLVGSLWLLSIRETRPEIYSKVDSFITLSTPFYGSKAARLGRKILFSRLGLSKEENPLSPMGRTELKEMSYGSSTILHLKNSFPQLFENNHIRFLAVSGEKKVSNADVGEGDTTVSPYSANPNHYAYKISQTGITEQHRLEIVPYTSVIATHFPTTIPGIARLEDDCLKQAVCDHPSIDLITNHLNGEKNELKKRDFQKFRLHIYFHRPGEEFKSKEKFNVIAEDEEGQKWKVKLTHRRGNYLSRTFFGKADDSQEKVLTLKLRQGKNVIRTDRIRYKGGLSTFVTYD